MRQDEDWKEDLRKLLDGYLERRPHELAERDISILRRMLRWASKFPEGALLHEARENAGMSTREAAERIGLSATWWQQIEKGYKAVGRKQIIDVRAPGETLARMANVVGLEPIHLVIVDRADAIEHLESLQSREQESMATNNLRAVPARDDDRDRLYAAATEVLERIPTKALGLLKDGDVVDFDVLESSEAEDVSVVSLVIRRNLHEPPSSEERRAILKVISRWALINDLTKLAWEDEDLDSVEPDRVVGAFRAAMNVNAADDDPWASGSSEQPDRRPKTSDEPPF